MPRYQLSSYSSKHNEHRKKRRSTPMHEIASTHEVANMPLISEHDDDDFSLRGQDLGPC